MPVLQLVGVPGNKSRGERVQDCQEEDPGRNGVERLDPDSLDQQLDDRIADVIGVGRERPGQGGDRLAGRHQPYDASRRPVAIS